jgi:hypothetical protein
MAMGIVDKKTFCLEQIRGRNADRHFTLANIRRGGASYQDLEKTQIAFYRGDIYHFRDADPDDPDNCGCVLSDSNGERLRVLYGDMDLYLEPNSVVVEAWFRQHPEDNTR